MKLYEQFWRIFSMNFGILDKKKGGGRLNQFSIQKVMYIITKHMK